MPAAARAASPLLLRRSAARRCLRWPPPRHIIRRRRRRRRVPTVARSFRLRRSRKSANQRLQNGELSTSFDVGDRASSAIHPNTRKAIKYSTRRAIPRLCQSRAADHSKESRPGAVTRYSASQSFPRSSAPSWASFREASHCSTPSTRSSAATAAGPCFHRFGSCSPWCRQPCSWWWRSPLFPPAVPWPRLSKPSSHGCRWGRGLQRFAQRPQGDTDQYEVLE